MSRRTCMGFDVGGTKIRGVVIEAAEGDVSIVADCRIATPTEQGYDAILQSLVEMVQELSSQSGFEPEAIGFGTPGVNDPRSGLLKNSNTLCLNGKPLQLDLESRLSRRIIVENDANCFAMAEDQLGAARGSSLTFGVILGTGVGGGVVINGRPRFGAQGIAGEWGHNVVEHGGQQCYCGKRGCVETVLSGPALERFYTGLSGRPANLPEICRRAEVGEAAAIETLKRLVHYFGEAISVVINILDPDVIVLGGGVSNVSLLYSEGIDAVKRSTFNDTPSLRIVRNERGDSAGVCGDSAGVYGAALLVL